ncbi:hypothetical protein ELI_2225 [Eubacterium callanderi]|uniref:Uncharacterized protein n=1 Tax=Eubacterium callanderi TaxID=53442 RepID=E3GNM3_9FIRM|nr:hypothetical protein ELI_2225 [Eubacterium callanderi]
MIALYHKGEKSNIYLFGSVIIDKQSLFKNLDKADKVGNNEFIHWYY